ncbi:MAG: circularly permuted type 2 ATP-grasp protein, partial [Pseudomonadota bacterium]
MGSDVKFFDELQGDAGVRTPYGIYSNWFAQQDNTRLEQKSKEAEAFFRRTGITFNVYGQSDAEERLIPFDLVPRILSNSEWTKLARGIDQRVRGINAFLHDLYNRQEIVSAGIVPKRLVAENDAFLPQMIDFTPPGGVYTHIVGTDIVRTGENDFFVLEDNARTPSGVSYMLENRETMLQMFPELFSKIKIQRVSDYPKNLRASLEAAAPRHCDGRPCVVVLTPGIHNSAYYEHSFLADQMGVELVEGHDLRVVDGHIAMRTTKGYKVIDVLYRRVDDDFLDPLTFNPESMLGVPGIMDVYRAGNITITN